MVFYCQRNCYAKELHVKALSCDATTSEKIIEGKKTKVKCFAVTFENTVFFPEGGGQPYDLGTVNDIQVLKVLRNKGEAVHYLTSSMDTGIMGHQKIDWTRRFDHMQQHSGQHLITAVADDVFKFPTTSWNLGEKISYIELDTPKISDGICMELEAIVNEKIRSGLTVSTKEYEASDPELKEVRTRGLPDDVEGPVRVVTIADVESNMCCGTHVNNLAELQSIKLLYTDKGKSNKTLLFFVAGNRVLQYLEECVARERELTSVLHSNPADHCRLVQKVKKDLKDNQKGLVECFRDLAVAEALKLKILDHIPQFYFYHRRDGTMDLLGFIIAKIDNEDILKVLTAGEENNSGILVIHGPQKLVQEIAPRACEIIGAKGGGKTRFTAKIITLSPTKRNEMYQYITEYLRAQQS